MDPFPRKLKKIERELLFSILPADKPGYKNYRDKIAEMSVLSSGGVEETSLILGYPDNIEPGETSSQIYAAGSIIYYEGKIDITINEEKDNKIEFDISPREYEKFINLKKIKSWNYSEWIPGQKSPKENLKVREIIIIPKKYLLAISGEDRKIWLYDFITGINHLIPLSNLYNQLMIQKNIRDPKIALKPNIFFEKMNDYSDADLRNAFLTYNRYLKKFDIKEERLLPKQLNKKRNFLKLFTDKF
jgi:hypothetical protein